MNASGGNQGCKEKPTSPEPIMKENPVISIIAMFCVLLSFTSCSRPVFSPEEYGDNNAAIGNYELAIKSYSRYEI